MRRHLETLLRMSCQGLTELFLPMDKQERAKHLQCRVGRRQYCKNTKNSDNEKNAVIIIKYKQSGFTVE